MLTGDELEEEEIKCSLFIELVGIILLTFICYGDGEAGVLSGLDTAADCGFNPRNELVKLLF